MVQSDVPQLSKECNTMREKLHSYREEFTQLKSRLQQAALHAISPQQLSDLEHFQNQLHIQLINIHDLKQAVKANDKMMSSMQAHNLVQSDHVQEDHERLGNEFNDLEQTLQELRDKLREFLSNLK